MRRARFQYSIALCATIAFAASVRAEAPASQIKVPAPVEARRDAVPPPEPKPSVTESRDAKGGKSASKKDAKKKEKPLAKALFSAKTTAAALAPRAIGWYAKGCLAGGVHLADAGPEWQTMRPSRNRAWGHPKLIRLLKRLASEAKAKDGWPGLLVGDIAQPRGGPMITGHASHQVGLDADVWLTPMPDRILSVKEREDISATTMLDSTKLAVDPKIFTEKQVAVIKRAASYREVERVFVNPAIKKALCTAAGKDRAWLAKVRPLWGHDYHFHIRMGCPNTGCQAQPAVHGDDGCGKEVDNWLKEIAKSLKAKPAVEAKPGDKYVPPSERRRITMDQLPAECRTVLNSPESPEPAAVADKDKPADKPATGATKAANK